jgi:hypothetical protein
MIRNSWNLRGLAAYTGNPAARWRIVLIALLLAFNIGSASQARAASAAQTPADVKFSMILNNPKTTLCTGEKAYYTVKIISQYKTRGPNDPKGSGGPNDWKGSGWTRPEPIPGVKVEAYAEPVSLGFFEDPKKTGKAGVVSAETTDADADTFTPTGASFIFHAGKKAATGNLVFQGLVKGFGPSVGYVSVPPLAVKVIPCKYKVKTIIKHHDAAFNIMMTTAQAVMTADAAGTFTGSTTLHYRYSTFTTACGNVTAKATDSQVSLTGQLDDNVQQFMVTETFGPTTITGSSAVCGAGSSTHQTTLDPLKFKVASSGGVVIQSVAVGTARIIVIPQEQEQQ